MSSDHSYGSAVPVFFCDKLLGLRADCNIPYCREWEKSTGWLLYDVATSSWFIGFECPDHGRCAVWKQEWESLINEAIGINAQEGFNLAAAVKAIRDEYASK